MKKRLILAGSGVLWLIAAAGLLASMPPVPKNWSDPNTWPNGHVPKAGEDVTIPKGIVVRLDRSSGPLGKVVINGTLLFAPRDLELRAKECLVNGSLQIGSVPSPFRHRATISLEACPPAGSGRGASCPGHSPNDSADGGLIVTGDLDIHGALGITGWTRLAATAGPGATTILTETSPTWRPGDQISLAPTDFDLNETERATVKSVVGNRVELTQPLRFEHFGQATEGVDERGEVGLLTRNVRIRGVGAGLAAGIGGHLMIMQGARARLSGVELTSMGQRGRLGRYPIHFHLAGDQPRSSVQECSLHDLFNRAVTIHGTNRLRIDGLVVSGTYGHAIFFEDGVEQGNIVARTLVMDVRASAKTDALLPTDAQPAAFWMTHPTNDLVDNVAAGSEGFGFWYSLPKSPTGPSADAEAIRTVYPRQSPLGRFEHNSAHSCADTGLFVDNPPNPPGVTEAPNYEPPSEAKFEAFRAYKNRKRGVWMRGHRLALVGASIADCTIGATFAAYESQVRRSLFVGQSANQPDSLPKPTEPEAPRVGFEFYDGPVHLSDVRFVAFEDTPARKAGALTVLRFSPFFLDPRNSVRSARFDRARPVYLPPKSGFASDERSADGYRSAAFVDEDGSVTGQADLRVAVANPFLMDEGCRAEPEWGAAVCDDRYVRLFLDVKDRESVAVGPVTLRRRDGVTHRMGGAPAEGPNRSFQTLALPNQTYRVRFAGAKPKSLRVSFRFAQPGDHLALAIPCPTRPRLVRRDHRESMPTVASWKEFASSPTDVARYAHGTLWLKLVAASGRMSDGSVVEIER